MIDGIHERDVAGAVRSKGEAGLEHLVVPLTGIEFETSDKARRFVRALCTMARFEVEPRLVVNPRLGKRTQGRYTYGDRVIEVAPHLRLRTVVHELAHCVAYESFKARGHSPVFKQVLGMLLRETYKLLDRPIPPGKVAPRRSVELPPVGTEVIVDDGRKHCFLGTVLKKGRTRCKVVDENQIIWTVPASMMTY